MKWIHIIAGLLSLMSGAAALYAAKGSNLHRHSGSMFVFAMWVMSATGALIAAYVKPNIGSMMAGMLTFYMVSTAWLTVRPPVPQARAVLTGCMLAAWALGAFGMRLGVEAMGHGDGRVDLLPPQPLFMFGIIGLLAGLLDARLLLAGSIAGKHRLARHLWRMSFAMFVATSSFFLGQARQFPAPVRKSGLLAIPVLLVIGCLIYWLVRVLFKRSSKPALAPTRQVVPNQ